MPSLRQTSFAAGELAETLWAATWLAKYQQGLRRCFNFFPIPHGGALNRPGSALVADRADKADHATAVWLVPFVYSELPGQAYAIDLGDHYARFIASGGYVAPDPAQYPAYDGGATYAKGDWVTASNGSAYMSLQDGNTGHMPGIWPTWWTLNAGIYELVTPWAAADLARLQYAQEGDIITLTRHGYGERELRRYAHARWTLSTISFDVPKVEGTFPKITYAYPLNLGDGTQRPWRWVMTTVERLADGFLHETLGVLVCEWEDTGQIPPPLHTLPADNVVRADKPVRIHAYDTGGLYVPSAPTREVVEYRLYRGIGKAGSVADPDYAPYQWPKTQPRPPYMGLVGASNEPNIIDFGDEPDYSRGPPQGRNPFKIFNSDGTLARTEQAACVTYFERRRVFANLGLGDTPYRPATVLASAIEDRTNFDHHTIQKAEDAVEFTVAGQLREEVRWVRGSSRLIVGASCGIYAASGPDGSPLSPATLLDLKQQAEEGAAWVLPLVVGDELLYVAARGGTVREIAWDENRRKYLAGDLSTLSSHFFEEHGIVAWTYQRRPFSLVWAVREDGALLSLTYQKSLDVWGWAQHELAGGGKAEAICAIPEGVEDVVYLVVRRTIGGQTKRYIERLTSRRVTDARLGVFLDSALTLDGRNTGATTVTVTEIAGGGYAVEALVAIASSADVFVFGDVGNEIVLDPDAAAREDANGDALEPLGPVRLRITLYAGPRSVQAEVIAPAVPAELQNVATAAWGRAVDELSGLGHLEGETVVALADGNVVRADPAGAPLVVTGGAITIPDPAVIIHVGLPYVSDLELLDVGGDGDSRAREKNIQRVLVEVVKSRGLLAGPHAGALTSWTQRQVADGWGPIPLYTGLVDLPVAGEWAKHGRAMVRQAEPLPCGVAAVTRKVGPGGE